MGDKGVVSFFLLTSFLHSSGVTFAKLHRKADFLERVKVY